MALFRGFEYGRAVFVGNGVDVDVFVGYEHMYDPLVAGPCGDDDWCPAIGVLFVFIDLVVAEESSDFGNVFVVHGIV